MSRVIDVSDPSKLNEAELLYAHARGQLTDDDLEAQGVDPKRAVITDPPIFVTPNTGDANTKARTQEDLDKDQLTEEELEVKEENLTEPQLQTYDPASREPALFDDDEDVIVDEEDDYADWKVKRLQTECAARGLSVQGKKDDLVARLERDDRGEEEVPEEI